jgi:hypothetical protein
MTSARWQVLIVEMTKAKQALHEVDSGGVYEYHVPRVGCTEEELLVVEASLGERLDPQHREFLRHAGGWRWFWHEVHLFGPQELMGGPAMDYALEMLRLADLSEAGCTVHALLPVASGPNNTDVFAIGRQATSVEGRVLWIAGGLVEQFDGFEQYFASMIAYTTATPAALPSPLRSYRGRRSATIRTVAPSGSPRIWSPKSLYQVHASRAGIGRRDRSTIGVGSVPSGG